MKLSSFSRKTFALAILASAGSLAGFAQSTLSLASGSAAPGASTILNLSLNSITGSEPSGLQWKLSYPAGVTSATLTAGAALGTAGKTLSCNPGSGYVVCVAAGNNSATIPNGVVAAVNLTLASNVTASSLAIGVVETAAVSGAGSASASTGTGNSISVTGVQPLVSVAGLNCSPTTLTTPATASCTVSLSSAAPSGGVSVTLASSNSLVTVPPSIMVSSGNSGASFTASAGTCTSSTNATVTASLNGSSSAFLTLQPSGSSTAPPAGLVAAYGFNEGTGSTVSDASGNGNTGQIQGATWTTGRFGSALAFDGSTSVVNIPDAPMLRMTRSLTLSAWVNPSSSGNFWQDIIYKGDDDYFLVATSNQGTPAGGGRFGWVYGPSNLPGNTWSHIAATYDGTMLRYYVNGVEVGSTSSSNPILTSSNPLQIGADNIYGQHFNGLIDEVRVYNVALTAAQVQADMNTALPAGPAPATPTPNSVQCSPSSIASGASSSCTVTLSSAAPASGASVALSSSNGAVTVPASVNVAAGATTGTFNASAGAVTTNQTATITAAYNSKSVTASLNVTAPVIPTLSSVQCSPSSIASAASSPCSVTLSSAAPSGGAVVALSSDNGALTVPASVTVAAGATTATFNASSASVTSNQTATVTAAYNSTSVTTAVTVTAPVTTAPSMASFTCSPTTINSGATTTCTVTLSGAAPSGGAAVSISDSNVVVLSAPSSVSVAAGSTSATFQATGSILKANRSATLTAGYASKSMSVTITVRKRR